MQSVIIFLAIIILVLCVLIGTVLNRNAKLSEQLRLPKKPEPLQFLPGSRALMYEFGLKYKKDQSFNVTYEVNVLEVSETKLKVSAYDFTSTDTIGKDPSMKSSILSFMQNMWVEKKGCELILDQSDIREEKLNKILS